MILATSQATFRCVLVSVDIVTKPDLLHTHNLWCEHLDSANWSMAVGNSFPPKTEHLDVMLILQVKCSVKNIVQPIATTSYTLHS